MDLRVCAASMRNNLVVRADLADVATGLGGPSYQTKRNDFSAHSTVPRFSAFENFKNTDSLPLPLAGFESTVPQRFLWFTKKDEDTEVQDALNTHSSQMANTCPRSRVSRLGDSGSWEMQDDAPSSGTSLAGTVAGNPDFESLKHTSNGLAGCAGANLSTIDADALTGKASSLQCCCCVKDLDPSAAVLQNKEGGSFDGELFTKYLRHVHLADLEVAAELSFLCNLAYMISEIEPFDLLGQYQLTFVTSSLHLKVEASVPEIGIIASKGQSEQAHSHSNKQDGVLGELATTLIPERVQILAKVVSLFWNDGTNAQSSEVQVQPHEDSATTLEQESRQSASGLHHSATDVASLVATSSNAAILALRRAPKTQMEGISQMHESCPCEWFICDNQDTHIRNFVIQGSESLASWQANFLFEPVQFEDPALQVLVHRGIYEAAQGLYEQLLPYVLEHLGNCQVSGGRHIRFTGHSLAILCGGDSLLHKLGLPPSHVQSIVMHRDIVPRSFACNFPDHVAEILRRISGTFRDHPYLADERHLYAPVGQLMILQPDNLQSPSHPFLPTGSGLYAMAPPNVEVSCSAALQAAQRAFLNSPHPLEILSEPGAYGSEGTIARDHDPRGYTRALNHVLRREHKRLRRNRRERRRKLWWPLVCKGCLDRAAFETGQRPGQG